MAISLLIYDKRQIPPTKWARSIATYGPPAGAENGLGKWTAFDITFVGRHLTVLRDGKMYHDNVEIPGPTRRGAR